MLMRKSHSLVEASVSQSIVSMDDCLFRRAQQRDFPSQHVGSSDNSTFWMCQAQKLRFLEVFAYRHVGTTSSFIVHVSTSGSDKQKQLVHKNASYLFAGLRTFFKAISSIVPI